MTPVPNTYRVTLTDRDKVRVQRLGPGGEDLGQPNGQLRLNAPSGAIINSLAQKAAFRLSLGEPTISEDEIQQLGMALFEALFDAPLAVDFLRAYEAAVGGQEARLRLELDIDEEALPDLAALPWEFLYAPPNQICGQFWLATSPHLALSRRRAKWTPARFIELESGEKLRIAVMVSAPVESGLAAVDYHKLFGKLKELANQLKETVELSLYDPARQPATRDNIDRALEKKPHIFHIIGHGRFVEKKGTGWGEIAVVNDINRAQWVDAVKFGGLFARHRPGIVLLQACEGGQLSPSRAFAGLASQIVEQNVPVVVAMRYEISNAAARRFAREFYRRLAKGEPVDKAVQEGRRVIAGWHTTRDFAAPMLFMRVARGEIFRVGGVLEALTDKNELDINNEKSTERLPGAAVELSAGQRSVLRDKITGSFNLNELRDLCFELGIDHKDFPRTLSAFARELIQFCQRRGQMDELVAQLKENRPRVSWP